MLTKLALINSSRSTQLQVDMFKYFIFDANIILRIRKDYKLSTLEITFGNSTPMQ